MNSALLVDTSFLVALWNPRDKLHLEEMTFSRTIRQDAVIPAPVLVELFHLMTQRVNYQSAVIAVEKTQLPIFRIEPLIATDMLRMNEIMHKYSDNQLDYVDIAIMAISERLNIKTICTFDKEDYRTFRPKHTDYFHILPMTKS